MLLQKLHVGVTQFRRNVSVYNLLLMAGYWIVCLGLVCVGVLIVDMCIFCVFANVHIVHHVFVKLNYLVTFYSLYTGCTICAAYNFMVYWDKDQ